MATYKGVHRTMADSAGVDHTKDSGYDNHLRVMYDYYEAAGEVSGSVILLGTKLPVGAVVYDVMLVTDALGSSTSFSVGDSEDPDRYITNTASTSAARTRLNAITGFGYKIDTTVDTVANTDRQVQLTVVDSGAITNTIAIAIFYAI